MRRILAAICLLVAAPSAPAQAPAALVRVDEVRAEPLVQTVPVIGRLVARRAGTVAARVSAAVSDFRVEVGDRVREGQVIAVLDPDTLSAERDITASRRAEARARLATRQAELGLAQQERKRLERLKDTQATSRAQYDDALQGEAIAKARIGEARAAVLSSEAQHRRAQLNLGYAEVVAPYGGVVTQRFTEVGDYVQVGQDVVRLVADEALEIEADVPYERLGGVAPGAEVRVALDDGTTHVATVRAVIPQESPLTRTRRVRFTPRLGETLTALAEDQSVTVHVPLGAARTVIAVHKDAVTRRGDKSLVYVVEGDVAKIRPVKLGEAVGNRFEVLGGLKAGERVVVRGNERLRPNDKVRVDGAAPAKDAS